MRIAVPKEHTPLDHRVAMTPQSIKRLASDDVQFVVESGAGLGASFTDDEYREAGAEIVNDVSGLRNPAMLEMVAALGTGVVIMHMQGEPRTMQHHPVYDDVVADVAAFLSERTDRAVRGGVDRSRMARAGPHEQRGECDAVHGSGFRGTPALGWPAASFVRARGGPQEIRHRRRKWGQT